MNNLNSKYQILNAKILVSSFILLISCSQTDIWHKIRQGNFELVEKGDYRGRLIYMSHPGKYEKLVERYRREIEKNSDLLPLITRQLFAVKEELIYRYKFTWFDETNKMLVLRYFAHIFNDPVYAGYQILFVYDTKTNRLVKIFVLNVPLE